TALDSHSRARYYLWRYETYGSGGSQCTGSPTSPPGWSRSSATGTDSSSSPAPTVTPSASAAARPSSDWRLKHEKAPTPHPLQCEPGAIRFICYPSAAGSGSEGRASTSSATSSRRAATGTPAPTSTETIAAATRPNAAPICWYTAPATRSHTGDTTPAARNPAPIAPRATPASA